MKFCPRCGGSITKDSPERLCARCLMGVAMENDPAAAETTGAGGAAANETMEAATLPPGVAPSDVVGTAIGPYKVLQQIG